MKKAKFSIFFAQLFLMHCDTTFSSASKTAKPLVRRWWHGRPKEPYAQPNPITQKTSQVPIKTAKANLPEVGILRASQQELKLMQEISPQVYEAINSIKAGKLLDFEFMSGLSKGNLLPKDMSAEEIMKLRNNPQKLENILREKDYKDRQAIMMAEKALEQREYLTQQEKAHLEKKVQSAEVPLRSESIPQSGKNLPAIVNPQSFQDGGKSEEEFFTRGERAIAGLLGGSAAALAVMAANIASDKVSKEEQVNQSQSGESTVTLEALQDAVRRHEYAIEQNRAIVQANAKPTARSYADMFKGWGEVAWANPKTTLGIGAVAAATVLLAHPRSRKKIFKKTRKAGEWAKKKYRSFRS